MVGGGVGTLVLAVVVMLLGGDPSVILNGGGSGAPRVGIERRLDDSQEEKLKEKVSVILADTEDVWKDQMARLGRRYEEPTLVLFRDRVESACGIAGSATGPFYCGEDQKLYLDLSFYEELDKRLGAPGDFAQAYVVAHEVGHHVQNLLGTLDKVHTLQARMDREDRNAISVRLELQADFYAGVWAHHDQKMKNVFDDKDIRDGLNAAAAIGDDRLQRHSRGYVVPESFTHGTSAQRMRWFKRGLETGDLRQGDTFNTSNL
jgi:predicted metalloprotease